MKDLEVENQRLRKAITDLTLGKLILQAAVRDSKGGGRASQGLSRDARRAVIAQETIPDAGKCCKILWSVLLFPGSGSTLQIIVIA